MQRSAFALGLPAIFPLAFSKPTEPNPNIPQGATILFQGDSITDAGRNRGAYYANNSRGMGGGYAFLAGARLLADNPGANLRIYNRGISGHKVFQLANRWEEDCLNLSPDVLSILIGVNDFWHTLSHSYKGTVKEYEADFRALLDRTMTAIPDVRLIICEPFAVEGGSAINDAWFPAFNAYRAAARTIAQEFKAEFIPYHGIFADALQSAPVSYWCPDGVHPSLAGAQLMADKWLETFGKLKWE